MNIPVKDNLKLKRILERVEKNVRLKTTWVCCNINAVNRLHMTDHGPTHVAIIANIGLKILRNLIASGVTPSIVKDYDMSEDDAEVVVCLGSLLHDVGNSIHRHFHDYTGLILAHDFLKELLPGIYDEHEAQIITSEVLHCVLAHDEDVEVLTIEAGAVRVADALDMEKGRARIPFEKGKIDIHSVSAMAIDDVQISSSKETPVVINIKMNNSAGVFQIDNLLKKKIRNSGLDKYVTVVAHLDQGKEKKIISKFELK